MSHPKFAADLWTVVKPSADVEGEWVAHCLNLDLVSQGTSIAHAIEMIAEAIDLIVQDDLRRGADPLKRGERTPKEAWDEWQRILRVGRRGPPPSDLLKAKSSERRATVAVQIRFELVDHQGHKIEELPPTWMIAANARGGKGARQ